MDMGKKKKGGNVRILKNFMKKIKPYIIMTK